ncbi:MAG: hypothetical protein V4675_18120 [Verrucomicrobiota bacterium]
MPQHRFPVRSLLLGLSLAAGGYAAGRWHGAVRQAGEAAPAGVSPGTVIQQQDLRGAPVKASKEKSPPEPAKNFALLVSEMVRSGKPDSDDLFRSWISQDWEAAMAAFLSEPKLQNASNASSLFSVIASKDPARAMALLDEVPRKPWNADAVKAIARTWAAQDPNAAMAAGLALPPGARRRNFLSSACEAWMNKDIISAAAWLKTLPRDESVVVVLGKEPPFLGGNIKSAREMTALLEIHSLFPGSEHTWIWHDFVHWSSRNPAEALTWAMALPEKAPKRSEILESALGGVATDQEKALALLPSLTTAKDRNTLVEKLGGDWGGRDPEAAWRWAASLNDPQEKALAFSAIGRSWAGRDPAAAVAFLEQNHPDEIKDWGGTAAHTWGESAPDEVLAWLNRVPESVRSKLTAEALQGMAAVEPGKALDHAGMIADNNKRQDFLEAATTKLARQDVTLASGRVSAMAPGPDRDAAIKGLFEPAYEIEPDSALIWAVSIGDSSTRLSQVTNGFSRWHADDRAAAADWLKRASLDDDLRQRLSGMVANK